MTNSKKRKPANASVTAQKEWQKMPTSLKKELRKNLPDSDHDRVPNGFDCRPLNPRRQESFLPADAKYAKSHDQVYRTTKELGRGDNGSVARVKDNKNLIVKLGHGGCDAPLREEEEFFVKHKLSKEPLIIPTKAVKVGRNKEYGLLRPAVHTIIDPQHGVTDPKAFTDSRLTALKQKLTVLSNKGYVFDDGLQLGIDNAGRLLQFDLGLMQKASPEYAFKRNDQMWCDLLQQLGKTSKYGHLVKSKTSNSKTPSTSSKPKSSSKPKLSSKSTCSTSKSSSSKPKSQKKSSSKKSTRQSGAKIYIEPKFHFHPKYKEIYQKVEKALKKYPEIKEIILTAFYPKSNDPFENHDVVASQIGKNAISFNMERMPTYTTIYHELYHILQRDRKSTKLKTVSAIENDATMLGVARMPKSKIETSDLPYFGQVPRSKVLKYPKIAVSEKKKGNKKYVETAVKQANADYKTALKGKDAEKWKDFGFAIPDPYHSTKLDVVKSDKNFAKGHTPSSVNKYLKTNIRRSQQLCKNMIAPNDGKGYYAYTKDDLIKIPSWMKSSKKSVAKTKNSTNIKSKSTASKSKSKPSNKKSNMKSQKKSASKSSTKIYINPKFHFHPKHQEIYQKVQKALMNFPEIKEIELTTFYPKKSKYNELPTIDAKVSGENTLSFNIMKMPTYNVIYHELYHVVQRKRMSTRTKTPSTIEMDATLFGMARMPRSKLENNDMPYFGRAPKSNILAYAKYAQSEKNKGNKKYIDAVVDKANSDKEKDKKLKNTQKWKDFGKTLPDPTHKIKFNVVKNGKNFAKGYTPSSVNNYLKTNIRRSQQLCKNLIDNKDGTGEYLYSKEDLIKVPSWMKSGKKSTVKPLASKRKSSKKTSIKKSKSR